MRPGYEEELQRKINEAENFFKHADRDPEASLDFNPQQSEFFIADACFQYEKLTGERPPLFVVYRIWFLANRPELFVLPEDATKIVRDGAPSIVQQGRAGYFDAMLPLVMRNRLWAVGRGT